MSPKFKILEVLDSNRIRVAVSYEDGVNTTKHKGQDQRAETFKYWRVNYEKTLLSRFQRTLDQPKSPFRDVLCYKHKGGHEQYVIRAFRKNYLKGNPNRIEFFSPFDMLSDRRLSLIITISKQF